jgi:Skp family chaperone for outer membrane proteins
MRAIGRWVISLAVLFVAIPAVAGNVGFLDTDRAVKGVQEGKRQLQALNEWANQRSDEVEAMRDRMEELSQQLENQRAVAAPDAIKRLEAELLQAQRDLEDAARVLKRDFDNKQRELLAQVALRIREIASEYAESNGFDAIFMLESQPMVYLKDSVVITEAVIELYDERFPIE